MRGLAETRSAPERDSRLNTSLKHVKISRDPFSTCQALEPEFRVKQINTWQDLCLPTKNSISRALQHTVIPDPLTDLGERLLCGVCRQ
jgi:hypothetical protein